MGVFVRFRYVVLALGAFVVTGVFGYMGIEGWSFLDSIYMTILTFTTVGYSEVRPLSPVGRAFTTLLMLGGVSTMLYTLTAVVQAVVEDEFLRSFLRRRRMQSRLSRMRDHFIVCGFGRVGAAVAAEFARQSVPVVIIDRDADAIAEAGEARFPFVHADATDDEALRRASVERARGLVAALGSDPDNVFVTLSARGVRPDIHVVARMQSADSRANLERAGANRVISPHEIGGARMAMASTRPLALASFDLDYDAPPRAPAPSAGDGAQRLSEALVTADSPLNGVPISQSCAPLGVRVLAIRRDGGFIINPPESETCRPGDSAALVGDSAALNYLEGGAG